MIIITQIGFFSFFVIFGSLTYISAEKNVKTWIPTNNIFNKDNWVDPDSTADCGIVEFAEMNMADIFIEKLSAKEFILPVSGDLILLDGSYLEIVSQKENKRTNCLKLKPLNWHRYLNPENWNSDVSTNPAVPDIEKIPCLYDKINFPDGIYSGVYTGGVPQSHSVTSVQLGNVTFDWVSFEQFKTSVVGKAVFDDFDWIGNKLAVSRRKCYDPTGCTCNLLPAIQCPTKKKAECLSPVEPTGFCHKMCGAFTTFKPTPGFSLRKFEEILKEYSDIQTHVSKISKDRIQVVFSEEKYSGDSVVSAQKFYEKLRSNSKEYRVTEIDVLRVSGAETNGDSSFWTVLFASLFFVIGLFGVIFYTYGDYKLPLNIRFDTSAPLPLSSTYRARFSPREDESGLIFDNQSLSGSVMDLTGSFDNPLYGQVSTDPDMNEEDRNIIQEPHPNLEKTESSSTNPLYDFKSLNDELKEERGLDLAEELVSDSSKSVPQEETSTPLIEIEDVDDEE